MGRGNTFNKAPAGLAGRRFRRCGSFCVRQPAGPGQFGNSRLICRFTLPADRQAAQYLDAYAKDKSLKPKESWDSSVVSPLNYPGGARWHVWRRALAERRRDADKPAAPARRIFSSSRF